MLSADLRGRRALVTVAASGIGLGTAELFARSGTAVALNDLPGNPRLDDEVARLVGDGLDVFAAPGDVGDPDGARAMVGTTAEAMGGLDYLVNNAGMAGTKTAIAPDDFETMSEDFWARLLAVNLVGPFRCTHAAASYLRATGGAVVNVVSSGAYVGGGSSPVYCASKAGLVILLARGLAPDVRVNAVAPNAVNSDWVCGWSEEDNLENIATTPLGRAASRPIMPKSSCSSAPARPTLSARQ
ncbi:MAG: SDR family oxidoreductase [Alphaproteobacteria bacterium]